MRRSLLLVGVTTAVLLAASPVFGQFRGGGRAGGAVRVGGGGAAAASVRQTASVGPYGGAARSTTARSTVVGPMGGSRTTGRTSGAVVTPGGSTIKYGAAGTSRTGPLGGTSGRGVGGVQVTTPGGQSFTKIGSAAGAAGPGGRGVVTGSSLGVARGPGGVAVNANRGGVAVGPRGVVAGGTRVGAAVGPYGAVAGRSSVGVAAGRGGVVVGGSRVGVATGRVGTFYTAPIGLQMQAVSVRRGFVGYNAFNTGWYRRYPTAWRATRWTATSAWAVASWSRVAAFCAFPVTPIYYDYGSTVVINNDVVYVNGEQTASVAEYTQQATQIADAGRTPDASENEEWQPLGVFALVQGGETNSTHIFQLAVNKKGIIRGNYYNALADTTEQVYGSIDGKTQRAAWTVGDRKTPLFEAGAANLTKEETTVLAHFGEGQTAQYTFVRVPQEDK